MLKSATLSVEKNNVGIDKERARFVVESSLRAREQKQLIFSEIDSPPERQFIELITNHGENTGNDKFPLNALFLTSSLVFAQNTTAFFDRITDADLLDEYAWIFQPERVVEEARSGADVQKACEKYLRPAGYSANALSEWVHNSEVLLDRYGGDLRNFMRENNNNAIEVVDSLVVRPRAKTNEKDGFRRFGPKLSRLFVQWVNQYGLYDLSNADKIGMPVDFQLARIFIQTGSLPIEEPTQAHTVTYKVLLPALDEMCEENNWKPREVSETLWLIGSNCCSSERHDACPISSECDKLISRTPYDRGGMFDPKDVGRFKTRQQP